MMKNLLARKFVITAVTVGTIYSVIVIVINKMIGQEAASIAAIALTAIATAIFNGLKHYVSKRNLPIQQQFITDLIGGKFLLLRLCSNQLVL